MKSFLCIGLLVFTATSACAQAKPNDKSSKGPSASHREIRVEARNLAAEVRAPLTSAELAIARRVDVGTMPCELGQIVVLTPEADSPGYFGLTLGKMRYRVSPELTSTGAIRLEDKAEGVVWLQLANKSMMMSQKHGKRLADECLSPAQKLVAQDMLKNPPPSILDVPPSPARVKLAAD